MMIQKRLQILFTLILTVIFLAGMSMLAIADENEPVEELQPLPLPEHVEVTDEEPEEEERITDLILKALEFQGNQFITDEQILAVMTSRPGRPFSIKEIEEDMLRIDAMGYFRTPPKYNAEPMDDGVKLIIFLSENPRYSGLDITITGPGIVSVEEIEAIFDYEVGEIISVPRLIEQYVQIEDMYRRKGYSAATVVTADYDDDGIVYVGVNEGVIKEIKVAGNTKTKDIVILRELTLNPGDVYNAHEFRRNLENIFALQLFEDITVDYELSDEQELIVIIRVTESRTGQFGFGAGYSSQDGWLGTFSYTERNFRGMGQRVNLLGQIGGPDPDFMLTFYSPVIDRQRTSMTAEILWVSNTDRVRNLDDPSLFTKFTIRRRGGSLGFVRPITKTTKIHTKASMLNGSIDVKEGEITQDLFEDYARRGLIEGKSHSFTLGVSQDTRDFVLDPSTGYYSNLTATYYGGFLGGDFNAIKGVAEYRQFINMARAEEEFVTGIDPSRMHQANVIAFRVMLGLSDGSLSLFDSFKIGGTNSVRGAEEALQTGDKAILGNLEYRFPIITNLSGAAFVDSGTAAPPGENLSFENLVTSVGAGLRYRIPFFGMAPLRLDFGYDLVNESSRVDFGFGQLF